MKINIWFRLPWRTSERSETYASRNACFRFALSFALAAINLAGSEALIVNNLEVTDLKFCRQQTGALGLRANVAVTFQNDGSEVLIIQRFPQIAEFAFFATETDLDLHRPEFVWNSGYWNGVEPTHLEKQDPSKSEVFKLIHPHEVYTQVSMIATHPTSPFIKSRANLNTAMLGKDHLLQVTVVTWANTPKSGDNLSKKWQAYGRLQVSRLILPPLKVHFDVPQVLPACRYRVD